MKRILAVALAIGLAWLGEARADPQLQKSGPEVFPGKHELSASFGGQVGLNGFSYGGGTPGGFRLQVEYGYRFTELVWLNLGVNLVVGGACARLCDYVTGGNTVEPAAGIKLKFRTPVPLVPYAKLDVELIGIYGRYCTDNGVALGGRASGGAKYFLLKNVAVGVETGATLGPAFLRGGRTEDCGGSHLPQNDASPGHVEFYAAVDFGISAEFIF